MRLGTAHQIVDPVNSLLAVAARAPGSLAVATPNESISYADFLDLARRYGAAFAADGEAGRVLIHFGQRAEAYAAMFGALMAGVVYAPVNVDEPEARRVALARSFRPTTVVTDRPVPDCGRARVLPIDDLTLARLDAPRVSGKLAYVMFTSGSTGEPKGVMISRAALSWYLGWAIPALGMMPGERCTQMPNIGFDLSVIEIFATLCSGACLCPITGPKNKMFPAIAAHELGVTVWVSVPSVIDMLIRAGHLNAKNLELVRLMYFCGEPLLPHHLEAIFSAKPEMEVINAYGPTEATVSCTEIRLRADNYRQYCHESVALGRPITGMDIRLENGNHSDEGEIVLAGSQLAQGYWEDPRRTAISFTENGQAYRTGDWANRIDGELYFRHRIDQQVKILGYRVELDEVDSALRVCGARQAMSFVVDGALISFAEVPDGITSVNLRAGLEKLIPIYALPKMIEIVAGMPYNNNGKVDARALQARAERLVRA